MITFELDQLELPPNAILRLKLSYEPDSLELDRMRRNLRMWLDSQDRSDVQVLVQGPRLEVEWVELADLARDLPAEVRDLVQKLLYYRKTMVANDSSEGSAYRYEQALEGAAEAGIELAVRLAGCQVAS